MPIPEPPFTRIIMQPQSLKVDFDPNQKSAITGRDYALNPKPTDAKEAELVYQVHQAVFYLAKYLEDRC